MSVRKFYGGRSSKFIDCDVLGVRQFKGPMLSIKAVKEMREKRRSLGMTGIWYYAHIR